MLTIFNLLSTEKDAIASFQEKCILPSERICENDHNSEWRKAGLLLSSSSDEACKLYDAALTQYVGWYQDDSLGGLVGTLEKMRNADPNFVMGNVLSFGLNVIGIGRSVLLDKELEKEMKMIKYMAEKQAEQLTLREQKHVKAVCNWASGDLKDSVLIWEDILEDHPTDMLALKMANQTYLYLGLQEEIKKSGERALSCWTPEIPLYSYLYGMYAFGLVETSSYSEAEKMAKQGLELNAKDAWATHALAHVYEMEGRVNEGISFLDGTVQDWKSSGVLAYHNYWHWALYHIEKGESDAALNIYDSQIGERMKARTMLDIIDCASLLYRLQLAGINVGNRWKDMYELCQPHFDDHILVFSDIHLLLSTLGSKNQEATNYLISSIQEFMSNGQGTNHAITRDVGYPLCKAIIAYDEGRVEDCCNIIYPLKEKIVQLGFSNAQRDIFNLLLITAAMKSTSKDHQSVLRQVLGERKRFKSICQEIN